MSEFPDSWSDGLDVHTPDGGTLEAKTEQDVSQSRLTYGGFISMLQNLGLNPHSVRAYRFGILIGKGTYFAVYQQRVRPTDFEALDLAIAPRGMPPFRRRFPDPNQYIAIKRVRVREESAQIDVSSQNQLYAICREIQALVHPALRDHESIVKLQAIIWENGPGAGNESGVAMWPALVMEFCETTLAEYQANHPPLADIQKGLLGSQIGAGLEAVHSANIFHGDLKSENVLIKFGKDNVLLPKLADFGCSVIIKDEDGKTKYWVGGTPAYRAPECPNFFTRTDQIAATDWYSFGLLLFRLQLDGMNPFESFGVIPDDWTAEEKLSAIQFMKETDCLYALLNGAADKPPILSAAQMLANMLLNDPIERMKAIQGSSEEIEALVPDALGHILKTTDTTQFHQNALNELTVVLERAAIEEEVSDISSAGEEAFEAINPLSFLSYVRKTTIIPDFAALSRIPRRGSLNAATRQRLVTELQSCLFENKDQPYPLKCVGCCTLSAIDTEEINLTPDTLTSQIQQEIRQTLDTHNCRDLLRAESPGDIRLTTSMFGGGISSSATQTWSAAYQLFLATATGFGVAKNSRGALHVLEEAFTSGFLDACAPLVLFAAYKGQVIKPDIPIRKHLVSIVLFRSGIPSDAFSALKQLAPELAVTVAKARSQLYNGSTASFENLRFNTLDIRKMGYGIPQGFMPHSTGSYIVQDEVFQNSLLHLVAGSAHRDISLISYCIDILKIDKDLRNEGGITPLLMACRSGREDKILALLKHNVNVKLQYPGGETALHWLGLLDDPQRVLRDFIARGADINAQVYEPQIIPNFIGGMEGLSVLGTPLFWAIKMAKPKFIEALLLNGADMHVACSSGLTAVSYACRPGKYKSLLRFSQEQNFRVVRDDAFSALSQWTSIDMLKSYTTPKEQEETLGLILSSALPFYKVTDAEDFYRFLVPYAVAECRAEIVEILLQGLSLSLATILNADEELEKYSASPLANPTWVQHRLVHEATRTGDSEVLRCVLRWGGEATAIDGFGRTPLHTLSFFSDNEECVDVLIDHGASSTLGHMLEIEGLTAFSNALACGNFAVASRILKHTAFEDRILLLSDRPSGMFFPTLSLIGHFIAWASDLGEKPIQHLFGILELQDNPDLVFVVDQGTNMSALMIACGIRSENRIYDTETFITLRRKRVINLLLEKFAEKRHLDWKDRLNNTALHWAAYLGNTEMASSLIAAGADVNLVNIVGCTPLDILFLDNPEFLKGDLRSKKMILMRFEAGRNDICMELKSKGGKHNHPSAIGLSTINHLPRSTGKKLVQE